VAAGRVASAGSPLVEGLATGAPERRLSITRFSIAHRQACVTGSG
jgi:hypothetical protein